MDPRVEPEEDHAEVEAPDPTPVPKMPGPDPFATYGNENLHPIDDPRVILPEIAKPEARDLYNMFSAIGLNQICIFSLMMDPGIGGCRDLIKRYGLHKSLHGHPPKLTKWIADQVRDIKANA